jgi:hypothetical protein
LAGATAGQSDCEEFANRRNGPLATRQVYIRLQQARELSFAGISIGHPCPLKSEMN